MELKSYDGCIKNEDLEYITEKNTSYIMRIFNIIWDSGALLFYLWVAEFSYVDDYIKIMNGKEIAKFQWSYFFWMSFMNSMEKC